MSKVNVRYTLCEITLSLLIRVAEYCSESDQIAGRTGESSMFGGIIFTFVCWRKWVVTRCHGAFSFHIEHVLVGFIVVFVLHFISTANSLRFEMV